MISLTRNFCIIAHIDHGKSTLADRLLEKTGAIAAHLMKDRFLDSLDLERERGITIKLKAIRLPYKAADGQTYSFNLIDTPGHIDFSYEVSRSLAACEGALLLVDAAQGIQAQTISNAYKAVKQGLFLIPVINKIDLPEADLQRCANQLVAQLGFKKDQILYVSGKTGEGVDQLMEEIVRRIPAPAVCGNQLQALVFDSFYDQHRGVVAMVRLMGGRALPGDKIQLLAAGAVTQIIEAGAIIGGMHSLNSLEAGEVGYLVTGLKDLTQVTVGDTVIHQEHPVSALPGYAPVKPMVFAGFYSTDQNQYLLLGDALDKFKLQDASLTFSKESSLGLGRGYRCGFLGTLHLAIVKERLEREYDLDILLSAPSVNYQVINSKGEREMINRPQSLPSNFQKILEPWILGEISVPEKYMGEVMKLCDNFRGQLMDIVYPSDTNTLRQLLLVYELPLNEMLFGFHSRLESVSSGYGSFDYQLDGYRESDIVRLDILVHKELVEPLSQLVWKEKAEKIGREMLLKLKELLPRYQFAVSLQAVVGANVVAREDIPAVRKDVTAKLYGGDRSRKDKLLEKQKKGKAKMRQFGQIAIDSEVFYQVLSLHD
ncbi:elongation factor 4 [candidate division WWE3 bacterium CG08_land_8_20_14_0_20_43_13]|uniref:Elongation factor 4 n=1 Tax=candidate division WWE3 bacterium CG08_land_8_20_14_0_20_43_13 TaxID=1975087 RepID=A0A2H0XA32_UNCKA|nr:MAG: elongation factor 4 [candidate division WWE3 bacterium CG08_land_8_20_14_0_20_43_13]